MPIPHPQIEEPVLSQHEAEDYIPNFPEPSEEQRVLWEDLEKNFNADSYNREVDFIRLPYSVTSYLASEQLLIKLKAVKDRLDLSNQQMSALSSFVKSLVLGEIPDALKNLSKILATKLVISEGLAEEAAFEMEKEVFPPIMTRLRELYGFSDLTDGIAPEQNRPAPPPPAEQKTMEIKENFSRQPSALDKKTDSSIEKTALKESGEIKKSEDRPELVQPGTPAIESPSQNPPLPPYRLNDPIKDQGADQKRSSDENHSKKVVLEGNIVDLRDLIA